MVMQFSLAFLYFLRHEQQVALLIARPASGTCTADGGNSYGEAAKLKEYILKE
jgi:hypothetical protein